MSEQKPKALVVLSGGQDSTTCLAFAVREFGANNVRALTIDYGQRHNREIRAALDVALLFGIPTPEVLELGRNILLGTSPLNNPAEKLETYESFQQMETIIGERVEKTFVPMRNALFLTIAANRAVVLGCETIYTGVCQADNANYPDCRKVFVSAQQHAINQALGFDDLDPDPGIDSKAIRIETPLMFLSKAQSIQALVTHSPVDFARLAWTHTAYDGNYPPVGKDHASVLRAQGFVEADWPDPLVVRAHMEGHMALPDTPNYQHAAKLTALRALIESEAERLVALRSQQLAHWPEDEAASEHYATGQKWPGSDVDKKEGA